MGMQILIDNIAYNGFTEATGSRSIFHASGEFRFQTSPQNSIIQGVNPNNYPLQVQRACTIFIDGKQFITGFSDRVQVVRTVSETPVIISGRDRTMDLIDSTLDGEILTEFTGGITLKQICEKVIKELGITDIKVIDQVNPRAFKKVELINLKIGESAFIFFYKYAEIFSIFNKIFINSTCNSISKKAFFFKFFFFNITQYQSSLISSSVKRSGTPSLSSIGSLSQRIFF